MQFVTSSNIRLVRSLTVAPGRSIRSAGGLALALALACSSCQQMSPDVYETRDAGVAMQTFAGVVQSARPVTVQNEGNLGTILGAAAGGVSGAQIGGGTGTHIIGGVAGAAIGAMAGRGLEKGISKKGGIEYVVRTEDGQLHTIVQGTESPMVPGQKVFVQLWGSGRSRVVPAQ
jgi:outer membrane lipoprotein SlyB